MSEKTDAKKVSDSGGKLEKQLKSGEKYFLFFIKNEAKFRLLFFIVDT